MSSAEAQRPARRRGITRLAAALLFAVAAAIAPLTGVIETGLWLYGAFAMAALVLASGWAARMLRAPAVLVSAVEGVVWIALSTWWCFADTAWFGLVPTPATVSRLGDALGAVSTQILEGVAPLEPTGALSALIVVAVGLLAVLLDYVVVAARMPLLASVALVAVWIIPAAAVPARVDVVTFVLFAVAVLVLLRAETAAREPASAARTGVGVLAAGIAAAAVVGAVALTPGLPQPVRGSGPAAVTTIDPTLELGDDLRQPVDTTVLRYRTDGAELPYLRVATLSQFDGDVWLPDRGRGVPLDDDALAPVVADEGIRVSEYRTTVEIENLTSAWLPVPFPAVAASGLSDGWRVLPGARTLVTADGSTQGESYEVVTHVPQPTLEQIRGADAVHDDERFLQLTDDLSATVRPLTTELTAGLTTDFDRLDALQSWFRGPDFTYSLDAPVAQGFDGSGEEAIAEFLDVRAGYCVHFAAAFASMARSLEMPTRIVVGFLPGGYTGEIEDAQRVAEAGTDQLHAWPEVHFEGIGWVAFEPTKGLGDEASFLPESVTRPDDGGQQVAGPTPTATEQPTPTASASAPAREQDAATTSADPGLADLRPWFTGALVLLAVAAAPGAARLVRERMLRRRARRGSVAAAWRLVQDTMIDIGAQVSASSTPRMLGAELVDDLGAPPDAVARLVAALERAAYARPGTDADGAALARDATAVRAAVLERLDRARRARALLLPRSLVVRPGSSYAVRTG